jgi:hypothetical protein
MMMIMMMMLMLHLQGDLPRVFAALQHLRRLVLAGNQLSGGLEDFSASLIAESKLQWLDIADNKIMGPLIAPDLIKLAVFSSMSDQFSTEFDRNSAHIFDASNNKLLGLISEELLEAYEGQVRVSAPVNYMHYTPGGSSRQARCVCCTHQE